MRKFTAICITRLSLGLAAALTATPAICAPVPAQSRSSAAAHALCQTDYILAPQERNNSVIATASFSRPLRRAPMAIQTIPITLTVNPTSIPGGNSGTVTITVQEVPAEGGSVLVDCDNRSTLHSPSGSWPYTLSFPVGSSTTRSFTVTTSSVSLATLIRVYSCETDLDITNPVNWQAISSCTVTTGGTQ